jgi:glutamine amidotransferase
MKIAVINYSMGNINSIYKKIKMFDHEPILTSNYKDLFLCDKIILPGVGHFGEAMTQLKKLDIISALNEVVIERKKPVLGICLGMQLMADYSEEGNEQGLGWIPGNVLKMKAKDSSIYKIPHIGWNQLAIQKESKLTREIKEEDEFYFVHGYHYNCNDQKDVLAYTDYEQKIVSAIEKNNIFGVQFHPEKSHQTGMQLLKNFLQL